MSIVLIGPWCSGKTTLGKIMAHEVGRAFIDLDELTPDYGAELGWSVEHLIKRNAVVGMLESEHEWEHVRAHAVERVVSEHQQAVIALGASYTSYTGSECDRRVRTALSGHSVMLVVPSTDLSDVETICRSRATRTRGVEWVKERIDFPSWSPTVLDLDIAESVIVNPDRDVQ